MVEVVNALLFLSVRRMKHVSLKQMLVLKLNSTGDFTRIPFMLVYV